MAQEGQGVSLWQGRCPGDFGARGHCRGRLPILARDPRDYLPLYASGDEAPPRRQESGEHLRGGANGADRPLVVRRVVPRSVGGRAIHLRLMSSQIASVEAAHSTAFAFRRGRSSCGCLMP